MYEVRPYRPEDLDDLRALIREVWPERPPEVVDNRWWWKADEVPLLMAVDQESERVVGMAGHFGFPLRARGRDIPATWFVDMFVLDAHQGKGIGKTFTRAISDLTPVVANQSQTEASWRVLDKLGWEPRRYGKLYLSPVPLIPGGTAFLRAAGVGGARGAWRFETAPLRGPEDADLDAFWIRLRDRFDALARRDAAQLWHRYGRRGDRDYRLIRASNGDGLAGWMLIRVCPPNSLRSLKQTPMGGRPIGLIVDFLLPPDDPRLFGALLDEATRELTASGARSLLGLTTVDVFHRPFVRRGFVHARTPVLSRGLASLDVPYTYTTKPEADDVRGSQWFLTVGDCDMDLTWGESPV